LRFVLMVLALLVSTVFCDTLFTPIKIPVRTGDTLAADLYSADTTVPKPVILIQTPYNKNTFRFIITTVDSSGLFDLYHYNFVVVDWRGFYGSASAGSTGYDRGLDGYDCVEWIASQSWCNGNVGTYGGSALGQIQFMTARHHPPHLVCAAPWIQDYRVEYDYYYWGGVFRKEHTELLVRLGFLPSTAIILEHPYYDRYWRYIEFITDYPDEFSVPMFLVTGWFDLYPSDVIRAFHDMRERSHPSVRRAHKLMVGPWTHSGIGKLRQGELEFPEAVNAAQNAAKKFFDYYLRGIPNGWDSEPAAKYFIMGINEWIETNEPWDSLCDEIDTFYLKAGGLLSLSSPTTVEPADSFFYDPRDPSPAYGGNRFNPFSTSMKIGPWDIRDSVEARGDNLIFTTDVLPNDVTVVGKPRVQLYVSSNRRDTDFAVRLCDVYPDGRSIIMGQGIRRARFRNGYEVHDVALMNPDSVYLLEIELYDIGLTFLAGHRIRIVITSSIYPMFDRNLNNGDSMYVPGDTLVAKNFVYHDRIHPSRLILPVSSAIGVAEGDLNKPQENTLSVYPNPFNSSCKIFAPCGSEVRIYDLLGHLIFKGTCGHKKAGNGDSMLSGSNSKKRCELIWQPAQQIPSGIYVIKVLVAADEKTTCYAKVAFVK